MDTIKKIREQFANLYKEKVFVPDKSGQNTIEILGAQFVADDVTIFGAPNEGYITREIDWYLTRSLNINDIKPPIPQIWKQVASEIGEINSNYGYLIFDPQNGAQYAQCVLELARNQWTRRAVMIYTRPSMWSEFNKRGMSDFICTNVVQYFIRQSPNEDGVLRLFARVEMRSNDAWAGYRNDVAWQRFVFDCMFQELVRIYPTLKRAAIIWSCGSLHLYERNFDLIQHYIDTGNHIPKLEELIFTRKRLVKEGIIRE